MKKYDDATFVSFFTFLDKFQHQNVENLNPFNFLNELVQISFVIIFCFNVRFHLTDGGVNC